MIHLAEIVLWGSAAVLLYTYAGYPLVIWVLSRYFGQAPHQSQLLRDQLPSVSLLISALNEEACIAARVQNALDSDYPRDKLEIIIASDGSEDATNEIVGRFSADGVRLLAYDTRRGKAATLNKSIGQAQSEIVVFSDANTHFEPDAIGRLVRWFSDPKVGAVCGRLVLTDADGNRNADGIYWRYETFLKRCEGRIGGLLGANGAIYAMRPDAFCPIPDNTIIDDFVIPLLAKLKHRFRIVYDDTAIAHEETAPTILHEFRRRVRIGSGDFQSLSLLWPLLNPRHGWTSFTFLSHKLLRWMSPFVLLTAVAANLVLLFEPFYTVTFLAQCAFYATAVSGVWVTGDHRAAKAVRGVSLFCSVNAALLIGFFRWATVVQTGTWQRTDREADLA